MFIQDFIGPSYCSELFYIDVHIFVINVLMYRAFVKMWGEVG